jgi:hypothetical protein
VELDGIAVPLVSPFSIVAPASSTRAFKLFARGPGGTCEAGGTIAVQVPSSPPPPSGTGEMLPYAGKLTAFPLPVWRGSIDGPRPPFCRPGPGGGATGCKQVNIASDGEFMVASGGDWVTSATDGTWQCAVADPSKWEQIVGPPHYPDRPAPHALQDNGGFAYVPRVGQFMLWPGSYFKYGTTPEDAYAEGFWWLDRAARKFTQDVRLWGTYLSGAGATKGGNYIDDQRTVYVMRDDSGARGVLRWDMQTFAQLPLLPLPLKRPPNTGTGAYGLYFNGCRPCFLDRWLYTLGVMADGSKRLAMIFFRFNVDTHEVQQLTPPKVELGLVNFVAMFLCASHGKVVWVVGAGEMGDIAGIALYDPAIDQWYWDAQVPDLGGGGNYIANAFCEVGDGRIAMAGGVFNKQQTHLIFYEASAA